MRTKLLHLFIMMALLAGIHRAAAQLPVITSFGQNGLLLCSNLAPGSTVSVQWASSLSGPWQTNWAGLDAVTVDSNGLIQVSVPMFYRVVEEAQTPSTTSDGMALIPASAFMMGDTLDGQADAIPTNVYVSAFYMDTNLVSYSQWLSVYSYAKNHGYSFGNPGAGKAANHPVNTVNWYDVVKWSNARSQQSGLNAVYYTDSALTQIYTNGEVDAVYPSWAANGYRLPTEAEWEKASRGGLSQNRFPWGDTISENQANYNGDTLDFNYDLGSNGYNLLFETGAYPYTNPVGYFAANGYGLYDMAGNLAEWCWDWDGTPYGQPTTTNPTGPTTGIYRILRGGDWFVSAYWARCACHRGGLPAGPDFGLGFRCVRRL